jgi:hypothetical protein
VSIESVMCLSEKANDCKSSRGELDVLIRLEL